MADENESKSVLEKLLNDRDLRIPVMKALAKEHPETYVPEIEVSERLSKLEASSAERISKFEANKAAEALEAKVAASRAKLMADHHLDDEGMKKVEAFMVEKKVADYDSAIQFMELSASKAKKDDVSASREFQLPGSKDNPYWADRRRAARDAARHAVLELQHQQDF